VGIYKVSAILFDLDGVLVDSMDAWYLSVNKACKLLGKEQLSKLEFASIWGQGLDKDAVLLGISKNGVLNIYRKIFPNYLDKIKLISGVKKVLGTLDNNGLKKAIVTNSPRFITDMILKKFDLTRHFQIICCGDEVSQEKPHPEICLYAIKILNVNANETVMVGDTENDIIAGRKAGCYTIGFRIDGDYTIQNIDELPKILKNLENVGRNVRV